MSKWQIPSGRSVVRRVHQCGERANAASFACALDAWPAPGRRNRCRGRPLWPGATPILQLSPPSSKSAQTRHAGAHNQRALTELKQTMQAGLARCRFYSLSERPVMVRRACGSARSALPVIGTVSRKCTATTVCVVPEAQPIFCRRRHQARRPPLAKIRPGRPAPTTGAGTGEGTKVQLPTSPNARRGQPPDGRHGTAEEIESLNSEFGAETNCKPIGELKIVISTQFDILPELKEKKLIDGSN